MFQSNHVYYEFGPYQLDLTKRVLSCAGETISLTPKATEILIMLVANAGQLIEKDELLREVWPDTFVEESNLTQNIFVLRKALGDERAGPKYIETITRRGYRFIASVRTVGLQKHAPILPTLPAGENAQHPIVAVLPFLNLTGNLELEYLADGVTDNLINSLSQISKLHVMSQSVISRYKTLEVSPQDAGRELGATTVLIGKVNGSQAGTNISVEVVDASTGWQLWGTHFDLANNDLLQIQNDITRQLLAALKLQLNGDEEKRITARYTEHAEAYQAYLEGRYHWSRYTRKGIEKAIGHFRRAIELDSNYALAYAAIVDCYLRLATNYLPPDHIRLNHGESSAKTHADPSERVKVRFEWDWKSVERELRRADELKTNYPSPHQWYVAYRISKQLYKEVFLRRQSSKSLQHSETRFVSQMPSVHLTPIEEVHILCSVARDQIATGNYEAARLLLRQWSTPGKWPKLNTLNPYTAADLLFTLGTLSAWMAATNQVMHGHKQAEILLSGSIAMFEQLGATTCSVEARVELARCFFRQGLFDIARVTLADAAAELSDDEFELRDSCLALWAAVERDSGRYKDALKLLRQAINAAEMRGNVDSVRCYHELAVTLKDFFISERIDVLADEAKICFEKALYVCEAVGNHRVAAAVQNNLGFLLFNLGLFEESETCLLHSKRMFVCLSDVIREALVNETLSRLYIETKQYDQARQVVEQAIQTLERTDGEGYLAEALRTAGIVAARQERHTDAKRNFEAAYKVAERCRDEDGAGRALLLMFEEIGEILQDSEKTQIAEKLQVLLANTQQTTLQERVAKCLGEMLKTQKDKRSE